MLRAFMTNGKKSTENINFHVVAEFFEANLALTNIQDHVMLYKLTDF